MNITTNTTEGDFFGIVQRCITGRGAIGEILGHKTFNAWLRDFVNGRDFTIFRGKYDRDDLRQDICLKLWEMEPQLQIKGNIQTEKDFFNWLSVVGSNQYYSTIRLYAAQKRDRLRSDKPLEEVQLLAHATNFEARVFLNRFLKFIEGYPEEWQWAVDLWLNGYTYRGIEEILNGEGIQCTHVTVRNWVRAIIEDFKKNLESPTPQKLLKQVPRWLAS